MAKFSIEIDTETAQISVSIDGQAVENVCCVNAYKYKDMYEEEDEVDVRVTTRTKNENSDVMKVEEYVCCENKLVPATPKVHLDIAKFLGKK